MFDAFLARLLSSPRAKSNSTSIDGPPFIWDNNSKAKSVEISSSLYFPSIISFKNSAFTLAALVVPGITL